MKRVFACLLVCVLIVVGFIPLHVLEIREARLGKTVFMQRVSPAETFSITFIHSVEKSPVTDYFRIDDAFRIVLYETTFRSLNTGLPAAISKGQRLTRTEKGFRLSIPDNVLPDIQLWVDDKYDGALSIGGRVVPLAALAGNTLLTLRVRSVSLWEYTFRFMY
jgi:hypothetical protein